MLGRWLRSGFTVRKRRVLWGGVVRRMDDGGELVDGEKEVGVLFLFWVFVAQRNDP